MNKELLIDDKFIRKLKQGDVKSYQLLYNTFASSMKLVCLRYVKIEADAEDILQEGFLKIYNSINQLKNAKSFVGWMKRIFINASLDHIKSKKKKTDSNIDNVPVSEYVDKNSGNSSVDEFEFDGNIENVSLEVIMKVDFSQEEILNALVILPEHFKLVFQLFVIDKFKHQEIAELLDINVKTSKTRLLRARGLLKLELKRMAVIKLANG